jgi:BlaI family transcriptional regulator, penicillinase repressor
MTKEPTYRLGNLQFEIMKVLWDQGPATVAEVQERLEGKSLAYTTVATMLRKMEGRKLVAHRSDDRRFVYEPLVSAEAVTRSMADDLVDRVFAGSLASALSHLLETREVDRRELDELERLVHQHKKRI